MTTKCIVSSCIIMDKGKTLILYHKKLGKWLYPGGHVDEGEIPVESAVREAKEETGFKVKLISKSRLGLKRSHSLEQPAPLCTLYEHVYYKTGTHMHFDLIYLAKPVGKQGRIAKGESTKLKWISEKEIDGLDTYDNVKSTLKYAFKVSKGSR
jgi:8-oxo-dGTP diphosphatase